MISDKFLIDHIYRPRMTLSKRSDIYSIWTYFYGYETESEEITMYDFASRDHIDCKRDPNKKVNIFFHHNDLETIMIIGSLS